MSSLSTLIKKREGFTLIETLVSVAILIIIFSIGFYVSMDAYRGYSYRSEVKTLVSALQKARLGAMLNLGESPHGVRVEADKFTIFQGTSYQSGNPLNNELVVSRVLDISGEPPLPQEIIFKQLSGSTDFSGAVTLSSGERKTEITINSEGKISW